VQASKEDLLSTNVNLARSLSFRQGANMEGTKENEKMPSNENV